VDSALRQPGDPARFPRFAFDNQEAKKPDAAVRKIDWLFRCVDFWSREQFERD
jgi:hypothetical protein